MQNEHTNHGTKPQASPSEYWTEHIRKWKCSGLSKAEYCRQNQLTKHAFHYWFKKLQRIPEQEQAPPPTQIQQGLLDPKQALAYPCQ